MITSLVPVWLAQAAPTTEELKTQIDLSANILLETFYFWTVVVMWLIHVGFMAYEAGAARRKNLMSTAMKNILTIAVVTPTFYYFGWYIYGCFEPGLPTIGPDSLDGHAGPPQFPGFCGQTAPWADEMGPNLQNHLNGVFFLAFLLFSWTTGSIMSGALIERVRLSAFLILTAILGSFVWIMDAAWGWSAGGWLTIRFGFHDAIASGVVHGVAGHLHARRPPQSRAAHREVHEGRHGSQLPRAQHAPHADGPHADLHRVLRLLRRVSLHHADGVPGLAQHLRLAHDTRRDRIRHHRRLRRRVHGRLVREQGRSVLDALRRSRRRDLGLGGRRRLPPVARVPALDLGRLRRGLVRELHREAPPDRRRRRRSRGARRDRLLRRLPRRDLRRRLPDGARERRVLDGRPADGDHGVHPTRVPARATSSAGS